MTLFIIEVHMQEKIYVYVTKFNLIIKLTGNCNYNDYLSPYYYLKKDSCGIFRNCNVCPNISLIDKKFTSLIRLKYITELLRRSPYTNPSRSSQKLFVTRGM